MILPRFAAILADGLPFPVSHYYAHKQDPPYMVWHEYASAQLWADDGERERKYQVEINFFTESEFDPLDETIRELLEGNYIPYTYTVNYDPDENIIMHRYNCEVT